MSAGVNSSQDFELNLASIIDCFTVLIAFMLATASFLSIGIMDAGIAASGAESKGNPPPPVLVTIDLKADHEFTIKTSGKVNQTFQAKTSDELTSRLAQIKGQYPTVNAATLTADNTIEYKDVIMAMETTRKTLPAVLLGGF